MANRLITVDEAARAMLPAFQGMVKIVHDAMQEEANRTGKTQHGSIGMLALKVEPDQEMSAL